MTSGRPAPGIGAASASTLIELLDPDRLAAAGVDLDALALTDGTNELTWREYAAAADRVAAALVDLGVGAGDRVGIRVPKTAFSFVVVHGVLRAGGIVVPVDPLASSDHAAAVLRDAEVATIVADHRLRGTRDLLVGLGVPVVVPATSAEWAASADLGVPWTTIDPSAGASHQTSTAVVERRPDDDAYIVYTSGSTGRPKGIVHTHASALAYAATAAATYALGPDDRVANVAGLHFDQSTFELYAAPLAGASALVVPDVALRFPASVTALLHHHDTTIWYTVPHVLRQLVERGGLADRDWPRVRLVKYGGESYPPAMLRELMAAVPDAVVSNVYGPAEVNQCTVYDLPGPPSDGVAVPIGAAWAAAHVIVVDPDDRGRQLDIGVGELLVATPTMMRGYRGLPGLTAERIAHRAGDDRRWYVTGDLVERGIDGLLRFVGRVDNQVKVRGQRVELEAVDAAIDATDGVAAGIAVVDRTDPSGDAVVAMVEIRPDLDRTGLDRRLLGHIGHRLSAAATPTRLVIVDTLPRTSSGKLDRGAATSLLHQA